MDYKLKWLKSSLAVIEHGLLMLLIAVILLIGIPSYIDVDLIVKITYYILAPLLAICFLLLVCWIIQDLWNHLKKPKQIMTRLLLLLVVFGLPLIFSWVAITGHKADWKLLWKAWAEIGDLNQTDSLSIWQERGDCCGVMGPYDYSSNGLDIPENCFYYIKTEQKLKDGCYKVFRDKAFIYHLLIAAIFAVYLIVKILLDYCEWKANREARNEKRRLSDLLLQ